MPRLTEKQWTRKKAPFCWLRLAKPSHWDGTHLTMVGKWLDANCGGWWYSTLIAADSQITIVFERNADRIHFKLWISDDPFSREGGEIEEIV